MEECNYITRVYTCIVHYNVHRMYSSACELMREPLALSVDCVMDGSHNYVHYCTTGVANVR
jgi:hypothetical protein